MVSWQPIHLLLLLPPCCFSLYTGNTQFTQLESCQPTKQTDGRITHTQRKKKAKKGTWLFSGTYLQNSYYMILNVEQSWLVYLFAVSNTQAIEWKKSKWPDLRSFEIVLRFSIAIFSLSCTFYDSKHSHACKLLLSPITSCTSVCLYFNVRV